MDEKYMALIVRFPLLPISTKSHHSAAIAMIIELTKRDGSLSKSEIGYGKVLGTLIQTYEKKIVGDFFGKVSGAEVLEYLLSQHAMKQTKAAEIAGISKQNLNDFLNGRRGLPRSARRRLGDYFKVRPSAFEQEDRQATSA